MMADDIRPASVFRTRRVRAVTPEDRQDDEERFSKKLAELREEAGDNARTGGEGTRPQETPPSDGADEPPPPDDDQPVGRHLDLRT